MQYGPFETSKEFDKFSRRIHDLFSQGRVEKARNESAKKREALSLVGKIVSYLLEGEELMLRYIWDEALVCFKEAWRLTREYPLTDRKEQLGFLARPYHVALFFSLATPKALRYARKVSKRESLGIGFLKALTSSSQRQDLLDRQIALCDLILEQLHDKKERAETMMVKGQALANSKQLDAAKRWFLLVARSLPHNPIPYEWLGAMRLLEGSDKAFYHLEAGWTLGGRATGFCRNLLLARILQKRYEGNEQLLEILSRESDQALRLFNWFLRDLHPRFLMLAHNNLQEFSTKNKLSNRYMRFLKRFKEIADGVFDQYDELRLCILPLVKVYWQQNPPENATYEQYVAFLQEHTPGEVEKFVQSYSGRFDLAEFEGFSNELRKRGILLGPLLLTFSHMIELVIDLCEELERDFDYTIRFSLEQRDAFSFKGNVLTFSGLRFFFIEEEATFKEEVRKEMII